MEKETMTSKEKQFIAKLLRLASEEFSNHCCNDLSKSFSAHFTLEEWKELDKKYHQFNEHTPTPKESHHVNADFAWMCYFAHVLDKESE